jgi:hypothetical protein
MVLRIMGPVGSSRAPGAPPGEGPPRPGSSGRRWALVVIIAFFVIMCGMIAWSQWYAIHVNVPEYQSRHHGATR